jgi:integrase
MTIIHRSLPAESAPIFGPTLLDVREAIAINESLDAQVRRNLISNVNTMCRVLDRQPQHVPASLNLLRPMMQAASPGAIHVSPRNWQNVKSGVTRAINLCGFSASFIPKDVPIAESWNPVIAHAEGTQTRWSMRRFARFCSARQITPAQVNDRVMPEYLAFLKDVGSKAPETCRDDLIRHWNRISAANPQLSLTPLAPEMRLRSYSLPWNELPPSLAADAAAFKAAILRVDPFVVNARRPVRQSTAGQYDRQIRRMASAALASGAETSDIANLALLVHPATLKRALLYFVARNNNEPNQQAHDMAHLALLIATFWAKLPAVEADEIRRMAAKCKMDRRGLTQKNRERLRQFRDQGVIEKLMQLPGELFARARRLPLNCRSAMLVQTAVAIALLINAPIRIKNLRSLDRARHFVPMFSTKEPGMQLFLSKEEVKNDIDLEYPLAPSTMALVDIYMKEYQPLLGGDHESTFLFPGRGGKSKSDGKLRQQIIDAVWKHVAVHVHPHLFRHLAAMIFLEAHPGCYEDVRRLLGHRSLQTTINFYSGLETKAAVNRYNAVIADYQMNKDKKVRR